ncbi:MAG: helix-turn-helix domain-containing protein, partial [Humibacillus sp.]
MGRTRSFDDEVVLAAAAAAFRERGYEATSVDDLVRVTGLHRGSLYSAFGSKRGIFVRALTRAGGLTPPPAGSAAAKAHEPVEPVEPAEPVTPAIDDAVLDLVLVALLEL